VCEEERVCAWKWKKRVRRVRKWNGRETGEIAEDKGEDKEETGALEVRERVVGRERGGGWVLRKRKTRKVMEGEGLQAREIGIESS